MLSENARFLAYELRQKVGPDVKGVGPGLPAVVEIWDDREPNELRPAIDELASLGFVRVSPKLGAPHPDIPNEYGLRDVASVSVMEPLQQHFDDLGM